jgi:hypothetical protein
MVPFISRIPTGKLQSALLKVHLSSVHPSGVGQSVLIRRALFLGAAARTAALTPVVTLWNSLPRETFLGNRAFRSLPFSHARPFRTPRAMASFIRSKCVR